MRNGFFTSCPFQHASHSSLDTSRMLSTSLSCTCASSVSRTALQIPHHLFLLLGTFVLPWCARGVLVLFRGAFSIVPQPLSLAHACVSCVRRDVDTCSLPSGHQTLMPLLSSSLSHTHEPKAERTEGGKREKGSHIRNRIRSSGSDTDVGEGGTNRRNVTSKRERQERRTKEAARRKVETTTWTSIEGE